MSDNIKNLILVASGKGGVGKSTIASNLALSLANNGANVGLLDADLYGPSIPTMFGGSERPTSPDGKIIMPIEKFGIKLMSIGYMVDPEQAMGWRGPMLGGAVMQFFNDVAWGDLDYLVFDLPPGTGDVQLSIAQQLKVTGHVLVTTPQDVALADVYRAKAMFDKVGIAPLGVIENMSYFVCPECDHQHAIFSNGGGEKAAKKLDVPFLGSVPIEPRVRECGDLGEPIVSASPDSLSAQAIGKIAKAIELAVERENEQKEKASKGRSALRIIQ